MRGIAFRIVARGQAPAFGTVAVEGSGIADAMLAIDPDMRDVLCPVVAVAVLEAARIEAQEGIMREEERTAHRHAERQLDAVVALAVQKIAPGGEAAMVDVRLDRVARRGRRHHIGD